MVSTERKIQQLYMTSRINLISDENERGQNENENNEIRILIKIKRTQINLNLKAALSSIHAMITVD
jgi:hypothetical protein